MANTFNFGNGNWAQKTEKVLAYNAENNNYKPLPFDFDRGSTATRVNKQGLIETVGVDEPRIDFLNNSKGHLLLEPERQNVIQNSEVTSTWTYTEFGGGSAGTITTGITDMFGGTNAVQVDFPENAENVSLTFGQATSSISSGSATASVYIKLVESGSKTLQLRCSTGVISNVLVDTTDFVRYEATGTKNDNEGFTVKLRPSSGTSSGGFSIIICHPQEEAGSYATSYIPTQGSAVTRSAETCSGAGNSTVFNDSEGVLYAEIFKELNQSTTTAIGFSVSSGRLKIYTTSSGKLEVQLIPTSGDSVNFYNNSIDLSIFNKVAFRYNSNGENSLFLNGVKIATTTGVSFSPSTLNSLNFDFGNGSEDFYGNVKDIKVYNTALTDAELIALTS